MENNPYGVLPAGYPPPVAADAPPQGQPYPSQDLSYPLQGQADPNHGQPHIPQGQMYPPQGETYHPQGQIYPTQGQAYPHQGQIYPHQGQTYPPQGQTYFPQGQPYPSQGQTYSPQGQAYPHQGQAYPPQGQGHPPQGQAYPPQGQSYPPQGPSDAFQAYTYPPQGPYNLPQPQQYPPQGPYPSSGPGYQQPTIQGDPSSHPQGEQSSHLQEEKLPVDPDPPPKAKQDATFLPSVTADFTTTADKEADKAGSKGRPFFIVSEVNDKVMDVAGDNPKPGAHVILYKRKPEMKPNQLWYFDSEGIIRSKLNDFAMKKGDKGKIQLAPYTGDSSQQWVLLDKKIVNKLFESECLELKQGSKRLIREEEADVISGFYSGIPAQHWKIVYS